MKEYVDLQINGYRGVNFSSTALTMDDIVRVTAELAFEGTGAYLATVITSSLETYEHVLPLLSEAMENDECAGRLLGIHLEGPFISPVDGARGAHPLAHVQAPSIEMFKHFVDLADDKIRMLTLAPERSGALELIEWAVERKIVVGLAHTMADCSAITAAVDSGATLSVHLGNAMPEKIHRHHNSIWPQLAEPRLTAMIITDGHHLPPELIKTILAAKGLDKIIVTSDAAPLAGCEPGDYDLFGARVRLSPDGCIRILGEGNLAGSCATMRQCIDHLALVAQLKEDDLLRVGHDNPMRALGLA